MIKKFLTSNGITVCKNMKNLCEVRDGKNVQVYSMKNNYGEILAHLAKHNSKNFALYYANTNIVRFSYW